MEEKGIQSIAGTAESAVRLYSQRGDACRAQKALKRVGSAVRIPRDFLGVEVCSNGLQNLDYFMWVSTFIGLTAAFAFEVSLDWEFTLIHSTSLILIGLSYLLPWVHLFAFIFQTGRGAFIPKHVADIVSNTYVSGSNTDKYFA